MLLKPTTVQMRQGMEMIALREKTTSAKAFGHFQELFKYLYTYYIVLVAEKWT